jgi:hypothetical protein
MNTASKSRAICLALFACVVGMFAGCSQDIPVGLEDSPQPFSKKVDKIPEIRTGYDPTEDGWDFRNFISPQDGSGGNCSGWVLTSLWYYLERTSKIANPTPADWLNGKFDTDLGRTTPLVVDDNVRGHRLVDAAQRLFNSAYDNWQKYYHLDLKKSGKSKADEELKEIGGLTAEMSLTEPAAPQYLVVAGQMPDGKVVAHALLVYGVFNNAHAGLGLVVADPNRPNREVHIRWDPSNGLERYNVSPGDNNPVYLTHYFYISGLRVRTLFSQVGALWSQLENGNASSLSADIFPSYSLKSVDNLGAESAVVAGTTVKTTSPSIRFFATPSPAWVKWVLDPDGKEVTGSPSMMPITVGGHEFGVCVGDQSGKWFGFEWIKVERTEPVGNINTFVRISNGGPNTLEFSVNGTTITVPPGTQQVNLTGLKSGDFVTATTKLVTAADPFRYPYNYYTISIDVVKLRWWSVDLINSPQGTSVHVDKSGPQNDALHSIFYVAYPQQVGNIASTNVFKVR